MYSSMRGPLQKREFPGQNREVRTYEAVDSFAKMKFLIRMWLPNPLGDAHKYTERLEKKCLKASHSTLCSKIRGSGNLLSSQMHLNLNCNAMFTEIAQWIHLICRWSSNLLKEFIWSIYLKETYKQQLSNFTITLRSQVCNVTKNDFLHRRFCTVLYLIWLSFLFSFYNFVKLFFSKH